MVFIMVYAQYLEEEEQIQSAICRSEIVLSNNLSTITDKSAQSRTS